MSISAVIICRDNAGTIEDCLKRLRAAADEIVVVDTGSTDNTVQLVEAMGIECHPFEWTHSFSDARNFGNSFAKHEWIFSVDSDEFLYEDDIPLLRDTIAQIHPAVNLVRVQQVNKIGDELHPYPVARIFRNGLGIQWKGSVHEQLVVPANLNAEEMVTNVRLYHEGHDPATVDVQGKLKRNEQLLRQALQRNSSDISALVHLGIQLSQTSADEEAVKLLRKALKRLSKENAHPLLPEVRKALFNTLKAHGDVSGAEEQIRLLIKEFPDYPDGWFLLGSLLYDRIGGLLQESADALSQGKALSQNYAGKSSTDPAIGTWRSDYLLGAILKVGGNQPLAKQFFQNALQTNPSMNEARQQIVQMEQQARQLLEDR